LSSAPHHLRRRVDLDGADLREVDHEAVVDGAEASPVVPAAADGDPQAVLDPVAQRRGDVRLVGAIRDCGRPLVDHRVVESARFVVVGRAGFHDPPLHCRGKPLCRNSHVFLPVGWGRCYAAVVLT